MTCDDDYEANVGSLLSVKNTSRRRLRERKYFCNFFFVGLDIGFVKHFGSLTYFVSIRLKLNNSEAYKSICKHIGLHLATRRNQTLALK